MMETFGKQIAEGHAHAAIQERVQAGFDTRGGFSTFYRYVILDVVFDPTIVDDAKVAYWEHDLGVSNMKFARVLPRNAVIAQRVLEGTASNAERPMFLFPFFPPALSLPCNPGEHIWVIFEDRSNKRSDVGYWLCRIVGPGFVDDVNHTHMPRALDGTFVPGTKDAFDGNKEPIYDFRLGKVVEENGARTSTVETSTIATEDERAYEKILTESDSGRLRGYESVPRYKKRPGDIVLEGPNNAMLVLGQHRTGPVAQYEPNEERGQLPVMPETDLSGENVGVSDLVVGRGQTIETSGKSIKNSIGKNELLKSSRDAVSTEGDPDLKNDRARVRLAQRSRIDLELGIDGYNSSVVISGDASVSDSENGDSSALIKADKVRVLARSDIQILVVGNDRDSTGKMIDSDDESRYASVTIKANGDIVLTPSEQGYVRLGGADANKGLVCTDAPAIAQNGQVTAAPLITTMGGQYGTGTPGQGTFASRVLVK